MSNLQEGNNFYDTNISLIKQIETKCLNKEADGDVLHFFINYENFTLGI